MREEGEAGGNGKRISQWHAVIKDLRSMQNTLEPNVGRRVQFIGEFIKRTEFSAVIVRPRKLLHYPLRILRAKRTIFFPRRGLVRDDLKARPMQLDNAISLLERKSMHLVARTISPLAQSHLHLRVRYAMRALGSKSLNR